MDAGNPKGLSSFEAQKRLAENGYNEPAQNKKISAIVKLILEFTSPLIGALVLIALFSYFIGEKVSALLILIMAIIGALVSFIQEYRAEKNSEKLKEMVHVKAHVIRDGILKEINLREIVPGDIVRLAAGDMVPGDIEILEAKNLFLNESALTGESLPVEKNLQDKKAFMGSSVASGTALGEVVATGLQTQFGKLSFELAKSENKTSFDRGIKQFIYLMLRVIFTLVLVIFVINFLTKGDFLAALFFSLAVAVGLVPEMLPLMVAVNLSKGAMAMSKKKVIVKKLNSIQNFGAMDVLCTDKTGTLTLDNITLIKHCNVLGQEDEEILRSAYINSYFQSGLSSVLDKAVIDHQQVDIARIKKLDEMPFDYSRRLMSVVIEEDGQRELITKGSPESVFEKCKSYELEGKTSILDEKTSQKLHKLYNDLSKDGFRVVAIASKITAKKKSYTIDDENNLIFRGFIAFLDPPKPQIGDIIGNLNNMGINLKIITGDNELVTRKICHDVNFKITNLVSGEQLDESNLVNLVRTTNVFVRISPVQKEKIIKSFQQNGHTVGFLGDGINDAPAIKNADVGISVDNATDIARETADIILLEKNLHVLEDCIKEGRKTFANIIKYIKMGASSNFGNMFSMTGASVLIPFLPLTPVQIILNNFLYDFCQITIPTDNVDQDYLAKPRPWNIKFIGRFMLNIGIVSSIFDFLTFGILWFIFNAGSSPELFRTGWFLESLGTQTLVIHVIRTSKLPFLESKPSRLLLFSSIAVVLIGFIITLSSFGAKLGFARPSGLLIIALVGVVLIYLFTVQYVKSWFVKKYSFE